MNWQVFCLHFSRVFQKTLGLSMIESRYYLRKLFNFVSSNIKSRLKYEQNLYEIIFQCSVYFEM